MASLATAGPAPTAAAVVLPRPGQLAALGTVLCLYRPRLGGELGGWMQAMQAQSQLGMDSDGLSAGLLFHDRHGHCCWRLYLLPDSDFLAWERLAAELPACEHRDCVGSVGERLWQRLAGHLHGGHWQASVLRLHVVPGVPAPAAVATTTLAASLPRVSAPGRAAALRIIRREGVAGDAGANGAGVDLAGAQDCCCRQAVARLRYTGFGATGQATLSTRFIGHPGIDQPQEKQP